MVDGASAPFTKVDSHGENARVSPAMFAATHTVSSNIRLTPMDPSIFIMVDMMATMMPLTSEEYSSSGMEDEEYRSPTIHMLEWT